MRFLLRLRAGKRHPDNAEPRDQVTRWIVARRASQRCSSRSHVAIFALRPNEHVRFIDRYPECRLDVPPLGDLDDRGTTFGAAVDTRSLHRLGSGTELVHDVIFGYLLCGCSRWQRHHRSEECQWRHAQPPVNPPPRHSRHSRHFLHWVLRTRGPLRGRENPGTRPWRRSPPRLAGLPRRRLPALPRQDGSIVPRRPHRYRRYDWSVWYEIPSSLHARRLLLPHRSRTSRA